PWPFAGFSLTGHRGLTPRTLCLPVRATRHAPLRAIRAVAGTRLWHIRHGRQWLPAVLHDSRRGLCWLELRLQCDATPAAEPRHYRVSVWQPSLPAATWRRLCLLVGAAQRLRAPPLR